MKKMIRTAFVSILAAPSVTLAAGAGPLPEGTMRIIVPYTAGGPIDLVARIVAERLPARIGRSVVVENRPGAAGAIAARYVAGASADGMTLMATGDTVFTINPSLYSKLGYDSDRDFAPVAMVGTYTMVVVTNPKVPARSLKELIELSRKQPLNFASGGNGAPGHLGYEYLRMVSGLQGVHIPYKGGAPATNALLGGEVDAAIVSVAAAAPMVKAGKLVAHAVATPERAAALPEVPSAPEAGVPDYHVEFAYLFVTPAGVPEPAARFLTQQIQAVLDSEDVRERLEGAGIVRKVMTPDETRQWLRTERARWEKTVKASGMKVE